MESRKGASDAALDKGNRTTAEKSVPKRYSDARQQHHMKREERNLQRKDVTSQGDTEKVEDAKVTVEVPVVEKRPEVVKDAPGAKGDQEKSKKEDSGSSKQDSTKSGKSDGKSQGNSRSDERDSGKKDSSSRDRASPSKYDRDRDRDRTRKGSSSYDSPRSGKIETRPSEADKRGYSRDKRKESAGEKPRDSDREKERKKEESPRESKARRDSEKDGKSEKVVAKEVKKKEEKSQEEKDAEEAAKVEAEKQRERELEEEKRRLEEEERLRKEEEEKRLIEEEKRCITEFVDEARERIKTKMIQRQQNMVAADNRPDDSFFSRLDSSLKKNTAFVRKLRNLTEAQKDSLSKDFSALNLSKYIGECSAALTEAKLKMSDVACAVHLCSLLHQRYADVSSSLLEHWQKVLPSKKDDKIANPSKLRVDLRFFADLVSAYVFTEKEGLPILSTQLSNLISGDKEEHNNLTIIISFCKHCGDDYAGLLPRKFRILAEKYQMEIMRSQVLKADRQKACRKLFTDYYNSLSRHVVRDHKNLKAMEKNNMRTLLTKGELSNERKEKFEAAQQNYQKLLSNAIQFADILDEEMPELPEDEPSEQDKLGMDLFSPMKGEYQYDGDLTLFEDEETRQFYENLPDLKAIVPGILYKDSENTAPPATESLDEAAATLEEDMKNLKVEDVEKEIEEKEKELKTLDTDEKEKEKDGSAENSVEKEGEEKKEAKADDIPAEHLELLQTEAEEDDTNMCMKLLLDSFMQSLPNCVNRELIDKAAVDFCMNLNTKANRKKLVKTLFTVQRTRYDLLPFYSRLVAELHPCMPDVAHELGLLLTGDFKWHVRKKDQINIESKLKTVRFIGELVKFNMFPKVDALHFLKMLLFDFSHHNIDMACSLLDSCGRYLYRSLESHHRTKVYLEVMIRKKNFLHLDGRYTTMIENAYYYSNPPDIKQAERKIRPPMHEYIRQLLYKELSKLSVEKVLRQIRKLDWDDPQIQFYATKCLTAVWNVRYHNIHCLANLLAGLAPYHEDVAINVVDGVLEDIRSGMEINIPKFNQRRVSTITFLGELYNYRMVESSVIFKILYSLITFGVSFDDSGTSVFDPPDHLFRIRLVCVLLDTCGQYFDRGSSKKKLDYFLIYFQRYFWSKKKHEFWQDSERRFPIDVDNMFRDSLETVRPKIKIADSYEEACKGAEELDSEFRAKLAEIIPLTDFKEDGGDMDGLHTIQESDETDENMSLSLSQLRMTDEDQSTAESDGEERRSRSGSQMRSLTQDMDQDHDASGDEILESAGEDDTEDICVLTGGPKVVKCQEDDDFMAAFDKIMVESVQSRAVEAAKASQVDIALPMHLKGQAKPKASLVTSAGGSAGFLLPPSEPEKPSSSINFTLMTKKGNKTQYSTVNVPITSEFATKYIEREHAEREEKERMKRVVLDIHERQEEEDYQEMIAGMNKTPPVNVNRERKVKYQHPKGAPDADAIFGSKRR
ncbi:regulator of nonsense transcripts 2-like [Lineus longissimus]|uniref:regulator of nonsense transcripts 2-like n=1 Tax=Lineus longissimus TaxID=88925 RepID=UPI002B4C579F